VLHDLSRVFPFHASPLTARPLDAFVKSIPTIFDFPISSDWHQLVLYGGPDHADPFDVPLSGDSAFGALGLEAHRQYYVYDFWNERFVGKLPGKASIQQSLSAGEARMLSVHAVQAHPQWLSTDRHVMQGYVDLVKKPQWNASTETLQAVSKVIENEPYGIVIALNGYRPVRVQAEGARTRMSVRQDNPKLADLVIESGSNQLVNWSVSFAR
jgi:hypothetical protein